MSTSKTSTNTTSPEPADDLADARELYQALASLVGEIDTLQRSGTPLKPMTKPGRRWDPGCIWSDTYPGELMSARDVIEEFQDKYSSTATLCYRGPTDAVADARQLYRALDRLVNKIDNERKRGTPLIALGKLDGKWDHNYPAELTAARAVVKRLKRKYRGWTWLPPAEHEPLGHEFPSKRPRPFRAPE
jgi:hypothetical protein